MKEWYDRLKSDEILSKIGFHENNPFYLETVFRTNTISAYNAGRWEEIQRNKENIAFLEYVAIDDSRTTEICSALDGIRLPPDDPFWKTHYPPNHFNCRSQVIEVSPDEVEVFGYKETDKDKIDEINGVPIPKGFDAPISASWWDETESMKKRAEKYGLDLEFSKKRKELGLNLFSPEKKSNKDKYLKTETNILRESFDKIKSDKDLSFNGEINVFDFADERVNGNYNSKTISISKNIYRDLKNVFEDLYNVEINPSAIINITENKVYALNTYVHELIHSKISKNIVFKENSIEHILKETAVEFVARNYTQSIIKTRFRKDIEITDGNYNETVRYIYEILKMQNIKSKDFYSQLVIYLTKEDVKNIKLVFLSLLKITHNNKRNNVIKDIQSVWVNNL